MNPEIDIAKPKTEAVPQIDFYGFNQTSISFNDKNNSKAPEPHSLEMSDPYALNQGLKALAGTLADIAQNLPAKSSKLPGTLDQLKPPADQAPPSAFKFNPGDHSPADALKPFNQPADLRPVSTDVKPTWTPSPIGDVKPFADSTTEVNHVPGASIFGKSPIIDAYERKQGARQAGSGTYLPSIDAIPMPTNNFPPSPAPQPRYDIPAPGPGPKTQRELPAWLRPEVQPQPYRPEEQRPNPSDLINRIEPKYETDDIATAVKMAKDSGLPLAVHIGASWCGPCQNMENNVWPGVEGSSGHKGSLQGKMVVLHLDVDKAPELRGQSAAFAHKLMADRGGSVPLLRVFKVSQDGSITKTAQHVGGLGSKAELERFLQTGGVRK